MNKKSKVCHMLQSKINYHVRIIEYSVSTQEISCVYTIYSCVDTRDLLCMHRRISCVYTRSLGSRAWDWAGCLVGSAAPRFPGSENAQECCACTRDLLCIHTRLLCMHKRSLLCATQAYETKTHDKGVWKIRMTKKRMTNAYELSIMRLKLLW